MKKSLILALVAAVAAGYACAGEVSPEMARAAANAWAARNAAFGAGSSAQDVVTVCDTNAARTVLWHQVSMAGGGCLVVAPVTEIEPVVAALEEDPGELPAAHPLRGILAGDMRRRLRFLGLYAEDSSGATLLAASPVSPVAREWAAVKRAKWQRLGVGGGASLMGVKEPAEEIKVQIGIVDGFEKNGRFTHWNQSAGGGGYCYNYHTPNHAVCGCIATAAAAMMQFFGVTNCPAGVVNPSCTYNGGPIDAATIGGTYDWNLFTNCTTRADYRELSDEQREMLGRVAYDAGVGVGMGWTDGESGAGEPGIDRAYRTLFGFKNSRYIDFLAANPTEEQMRKLIYAQCWAGVPVGVSIESHSVVAVGYGIDADGVERVRVFMGWGGSGDAWYALPYIDTKATEGGANYLSEVVDGLVTMIGYDTDDIVPVVGQVNMAGVSVALPGVTDTNGETRVIAADANGYFATRVPASMPGGTLECMGKTAAYTIGEAAAESTDPDELIEAIPDWVMPWPLLNATVCFRLEDAIAAALAENKAVLRVSGTGGDAGTQAVLDYVYGLDEANEGDFTNRFVYIYSEAGSTAGDVSPSVGVYLPQEMDAADRWIASNGMLTYDWNVDSEDRVQTVLDVGWDLYQRRSGNTKLTIVTPTFENGTPLFTITYEGSTNTVEETPAAAAYVNAFTDGQEVTVKSLSELTNETAGVVLACAGWTLTNETTGAVQKGSGTTATFTVATNDVVSLLWSVKTNAVYVTVTTYNVGGGGRNNKVTPEGGWYPYGVTATFTAEPDVAGGFVFEDWCGADGMKVFGLVEGVSKAGLMFVTDCLAPVSVQANFRRGSRSSYAPAETNTVTVLSYALEIAYVDEEEVLLPTPFAEVATVPETKVVAVPGQTISLADGESADVPAITVGFSIPGPVTDATGGVWRCVGWQVEKTKETGSGSGAGINVSEDMTLVWVWEREIVEDDSGGGDVPESDLIPVPPEGEQLLTIYSNADGTLTVEAKIANGHKGYYYSLYAANELSGPWATVEKMQTGYEGTGLVQAEADGEVDLSITFDPDEAKKFYKVVVDKENPAL